MGKFAEMTFNAQKKLIGLQAEYQRQIDFELENLIYCIEKNAERGYNSARYLVNPSPKLPFRADNMAMALKERLKKIDPDVHVVYAACTSDFYRYSQAVDMVITW